MSLKPLHETAMSNVAVPTISIKNLKYGDIERKVVAIQWFGDATGGELPKDAQFFFEPHINLDSAVWYGEPDKFKVVFIGPVRDWPRPEIAKEVADSMTGGDLDSCIVWMVSSHFSNWELRRQGRDLQSIVVRVVLLADSNCGVICPLSYCAMGVLAEEQKKSETKARDTMTLADKLVEDPEMELPQERIPWVENPPSCHRCEPLENSHSGRPAVPWLGECFDLIHTCAACGRRWWQYNDHFHLWQRVTSQNEWRELRRQDILKKAGMLVQEE